MAEIKIQAECFQWAWNTHPETRRCLFHVPNGGSRNKIEAVQLRASGVVAGVPDLLFVWRGRLYAFELKNGKEGRVSNDQKLVHSAWLQQGITVYIIRSVEEFKKVFLSIING